MEQVQQHSWVMYRHGVYDVKEFAAIHPGGTKVLQAAGKSMELFWQQSELHTRSGPSETLEGLRIGNLRQEDFDRMQDVKEKHSTALQKFFFVEGASAPEVDSDAFELKISGVSERGGEAALSLAELKTRFKQHQVTTTIRCATPRAADASSMQAVTQTPAEWTGVLLADVLASVGVTSTEDIVEVRFEALDADKQGRPFGASFPATTALDREVGVLLAYEMDGACIPKEHGFPLRVVVPGSTGARNVKFVHRIVVVRRGRTRQHEKTQTRPELQNAAFLKVNTHGYQGLEAYRGPDRGGLKDLTNKLTKSLWDSEYGEKDATGLTMAESIGLDINEMGVSGFVYWQALDSGGWGLIQSNPGDNWIGTPNPSTTCWRSTRATSVRKLLVVVTVNMGDAQTVTFDLASFAAVAGPINAWTTETSGTGALYKASTVKPTDKSFSADFPAGSVMTFEIEGVTLAA
ncbi:hypothetical protein PI125_g6718 [Phytophthora idaei]|nr:hypothetical protein PI125_g6718 [Phytophthora idaei]